jgi:hypothetical protein
MNPSRRVRHDPLNTVCLHPRTKARIADRSYRTLRDGSVRTLFPGISCQATIVQSLRDKSPTSPYGTTFDFVNRASFAKKSSNMNRWSTL